MKVRLLWASLIMLSACVTSSLPEKTICELAQDQAAADAQFPESTGQYLALTTCLANPDPAIRDAFAYERFTEALRNRTPSEETRLALAERLINVIEADNPASDGIEPPFAILVLAEVARTDRIEPYLSPEQRHRLVDVGTTYLSSVRDYRGFDPDTGWRHGVAHGADLMLQLALNDSLTNQDATRIRAAIASQIIPSNQHFYTFGEPRRLARPIVFLAMAGHFEAEDWTTWFAELEADEADPAWQSAYSSLQGLAHLHNTRQFASAVLIWTADSENAALLPLAEGARAVLASLP